MWAGNPNSWESRATSVADGDILYLDDDQGILLWKAAKSFNSTTDRVTAITAIWVVEIETGSIWSDVFVKSW